MTKLMLIKDRNTLNCRWLCDFANELMKKGYEVHIVCDSINKAGTSDILNPGIRVTNLSERTKNPLINFWYRIRRHCTIASFRYARLIKKEKPDLLIYYFPKDLFNANFLQNYHIPVIQMVHGEPKRLFAKFCENPIKKAVYSYLFKKVDVFQVLMESFKGQIGALFPIKKEVVIGNLVNQIPLSERADTSFQKNKIVYIARIEKGLKRQHLLLEAFGKTAHNFPDWCVDFYGEMKSDEYANEMKKRAQELGISSQICFKGYTQDVGAAYKSADISAFPSSSEGFPLGLADGMAHGLPTIGFAQTAGVNGLLKDGQNGFLVKDTDEFAEKLALLMRDKDLRIRLGNQAAEDVKNFSPEVILNAWDDLIRKTIESAS